jgi:hypothetical protein
VRSFFLTFPNGLQFGKRDFVEISFSASPGANPVYQDPADLLRHLIG